MSEEIVRYDVADGIGTITLNRPDAMNSLSVATKEALKAAVERAAADDAARCVVITGTGRAFCVGQDLKEHVELMAGPERETLWSTVEEHYTPIARGLAEMPKPVVAAVNGIAAGAGASIAFACDFRVLADTAGFNLAFTGVALSCDTGISWTLPRLIGSAKATELLYFPRTVGAAEAFELGLASQVVPAADLTATTYELAARLASGPTVAYAGVRASLAYGASHTFAETLAFEESQMRRTGDTEDHQNAVKSFVAKQKPTFTGH
ncbi:MAG TPA: enoyl-CoA hydratase-related protein [Kribbellaceae bacterium]|nr:enoyl-CoA hydratase-related protein [Kribbellaceae bacterium]